MCVCVCVRERERKLQDNSRLSQSGLVFDRVNGTLQARIARATPAHRTHVQGVVSSTLAVLPQPLLLNVTCWATDSLNRSGMLT